MTEPLYDITSAWFNVPESPEDVARKFFDTIDAFQAIEPSLKDWFSSDDMAGEAVYALAPLRPRMTDWVAAHEASDDEGRDPSMGYSVYAVSGGEPKPVPASRRAIFALRGGAEFRNYNMFEVGNHTAPPDPALVTFPLYKAALLTMISVWPAPWACAKCSIWGQDPPTLPGEPPFPYSGYQMPWISYLCAERAARAAVPNGVKTERTPDGGLLMIATKERFDPTNVEHMRPSRSMAEIMIEHGGNPGW